MHKGRRCARRPAASGRRGLGAAEPFSKVLDDRFLFGRRITRGHAVVSRLASRGVSLIVAWAPEGRLRRSDILAVIWAGLGGAREGGLPPSRLGDGWQTDAMVTREWGRQKIRDRGVIVESLSRAIGNVAGG